MTDQLMSLERAQFIAEYSHPHTGYCIDYEDAQLIANTIRAAHEWKARCETFSPLATLVAACEWQGGTIWQVIDEIRRLKDANESMRAKIAELESNERAYEEIIGPKSYQEVTEEIAELRKYELTEVMIDAPRSLLMIYGSKGLSVGEMREHCKACGDDISCWPDWAKEQDREHLTKAGAAILIYTMMRAAEKDQAK
jgi:hypothetical protein